LASFTGKEERRIYGTTLCILAECALKSGRHPFTTSDGVESLADWTLWWRQDLVDRKGTEDKNAIFKRLSKRVDKLVGVG
jgi:hypothetical protein